MVPSITYNTNSGIHIITCDEIDLETEYFEDTVDVRCPTVGQVTVEQGYIEGEKEIVCQDCQNIVPNCLFCFNSTSCSMCKSGYYETQLYDAFGNQNTICLKGFCGLFGVGINCDTDRATTQVENCLKT